MKELYANAFGCANPQCKASLYRVNSDETRSLNSRVAHICARRENGPRWDPEMSPEENRSVGNLLMMCIPHSYEVDDPQRVHLFSKELLRSWKERQLAEYDETRKGWQLTDAEAEEVIRESYASEVIIQGDTINLGGQGGQAPECRRRRRYSHRARGYRRKRRPRRADDLQPRRSARGSSRSWRRRRGRDQS